MARAGRFEDWRADAVRRLEADHERLDAVMAATFDELQLGMRMGRDLFTDALEGQEPLLRLLSSALTLGFWWWRLPLAMFHRGMGLALLAGAPAVIAPRRAPPKLTGTSRPRPHAATRTSTRASSKTRTKARG